VLRIKQGGGALRESGVAVAVPVEEDMSGLVARRKYVRRVKSPALVIREDSGDEAGIVRGLRMPGSDLSVLARTARPVRPSGASTNTFSGFSWQFQYLSILGFPAFSLLSIPRRKTPEFAAAGTMSLPGSGAQQAVGRSPAIMSISPACPFGVAGGTALPESARRLGGAGQLASHRGCHWRSGSTGILKRVRVAARGATSATPTPIHMRRGE
jgi:hypothetical protein